MSVEGGSGGGVAVPVVVNEGPVRSLEGFRPMNASDKNTIDFKGGTIAPSQPLVIAQAEEVAAAAWEKSELPVSPRGEPTPKEAVSQVEPGVMIPVILPIPSTIVEDNDFLTELSPKTGTRVLGRVSPGIAPQPTPQEQEAVEEEILVENRLPNEHEVLEEEEETENFELKDLLDEEVSEQRVHDIGKAIDLARVEADREGVSGIEGWRIIKFISFQIGLLSQIVRKRGRDGSLDETVEELAARRFRSAEEAKEKSKVIVSRNEPVRKGKEGKKVGEEAVAKVLRYQLVKGSQEPAPVLSDVTSEVRETSLSDYPELEEVFQG